MGGDTFPIGLYRGSAEARGSVRRHELLPQVATEVHNTLFLYPNPVGERVSFRVPTGYMGGSYRLVNALGKSVVSGIFHGGEVESIDVGHLSVGMYYLIVEGKEKELPTITGKLMIHR